MVTFYSTNIMIISDKHLFLTASSDLKELIKPLQGYGIDYFAYNKNYMDGSRIRLTTHPHHLKAFLENKYYLTGNIDALPTLYLNQVALFSTLKNQSLVEWARNEFNVFHGIYIVRKSELFTEFFCFATSIDNPQILNFYLNNIDFLQKFCDYFIEMGKPLILKAEDNKLVHEYHDKEGLSSSAIADVNLLHADYTLAATLFSERKRDIIHWLLKGYRAKEIAKKLNISYRTVEDHLADLKSKLNARNILELVIRLKTYSNVL